MKKSIARVAVSAALTGLVLTGAAAPALANPVTVDEPATSDLENPWTFAPLGVPVFGLIQSVVRAPNGLIPN
jgi:hypothetical protein